MKTLFQSLKITIAFCFILFTGYVLVLLLIVGVAKPNNGQAELLTLGGHVVGAANVGQQFSDSTYFWSRPSAVDYDGGGSGASNKGVTNAEYLGEVSGRVDAFLTAHPYLNRSEVPSEMVTASASGLDPHISIEAAAVQIQRVAIARGVEVAAVEKIVEKTTQKPVFGKPYINVLELNIALDENNF